MFAKVGLGHSMDLLHSPPVDLQIRIDHCDYMHAQFTHGGIILKKFPAPGKYVRDWELGPNCTGPNKQRKEARVIVLF